MKTQAAALLLVIGLSGGLVACETATPYQPMNPHSGVYGGFSDQRLDADHYRVSFAGNSVTSRSTVENYLLYRAADLTVKAGYDWFETVDNHTDKQQTTYTDSIGPWGYGAFDPYWSVWGPDYGWRGFWGGPYWDPSFQTTTVQRYEATTNILMGHGAKPENPRAFDAHQVLTNLGPHIVLPK
ncbi:MAG: hypothetical protein KGL69_00505 [Alphaproteobacteria bacterium]|jgi:hypothetical protein|nr:hypothetical protein [Alphaproteobacteria bacterium]